MVVEKTRRRSLQAAGGIRGEQIDSPSRIKLWMLGRRKTRRDDLLFCVKEAQQTKQALFRTLPLSSRVCLDRVAEVDKQIHPLDISASRK